MACGREDQPWETTQGNTSFGREDSSRGPPSLNHTVDHKKTHKIL